jgi:hypothetical protein
MYSRHATRKAAAHHNWLPTTNKIFIMKAIITYYKQNSMIQVMQVDAVCNKKKKSRFDTFQLSDELDIRRKGFWCSLLHCCGLLHCPGLFIKCRSDAVRSLMWSVVVKCGKRWNVSRLPKSSDEPQATC